MAFFLKHHFNPDFDYTKLSPKELEDGSVDHYSLDFVQNVTRGQLLAELIPVDDDADLETFDLRFVQDEAEFPAGRGTALKKSDPYKLFAARDGYVLIMDGKITVRSTLNVRSDVNFTTGNISFVGCLNVYGSIRADFEVQALCVDVSGAVGPARVKALEGVTCRGGIKGGGRAFIEAGEDIKTSFCEGALLKAAKNVMVQGSVMHSTIFAGNRLAVGGRLVDSEIYAHEYVYVGERLGGGIDSNLSIVLGYHPMLLYADYELRNHISRLLEEIDVLERALSRGGPDADSVRKDLEIYIQRLDKLRKRHINLWATISMTEKVKDCRVLVPGEVKPGVEISIGDAYLRVDDYYEDVYFYFEDNEVKIGNSVKSIKAK